MSNDKVNLVKGAKSLKFKVMVVILVILTLSLGITMSISIFQIRSEMKSALENEIYASALMVRNTIYNNLNYFTLEKFSGMDDFFKGVLKTNKTLNYVFISDRKNKKVLYHSNLAKENWLLKDKFYTKEVLDSERTVINVGGHYEIVIPINHKDKDSGKVKNIGNVHIGVKQSVIDSKILTIIITMIIIFVISLMVSVVLLTLFISRNVLKPISQLSLEMEEITDEMTFDREVKVRSNDEIGILAKDFNIMINEIRNYSENLEEIVADRTRELQEKNDKIKKDLEIAKKLQEEVIVALPDTPELFIDSYYTAMEELGGDIYDVRKIGKATYSFMIADVSGHGVPAALITTMAKTSFINNGHFTKTTALICDETNKDMYSLIGETAYYLTAFYAKLDVVELKLQYTNCGHHKGIVYRKDTGNLDELDSMGQFIGISHDTVYEYGETNLNIGDKLFFFTDGFPEARAEDGTFYGNDRLEELIKDKGNLKPKEFVDLFLNDVKEFCGTQPADDDRAILIVEIKSSQESPIIEMGKVGLNDEQEMGDGLTERDIDILNKTIKLLNLDKKPLNNQINEAIKKFKNQEIDQALELLIRLHKFFPNNVKILNTLGVIHYKKEQYNKSLELFEKIKTIQPDFSNIEETINNIKTHITV